MAARRRVGLTLALICTGAVCTSCEAVFNPCYDEFYHEYNDTLFGNDRSLDGPWNLVLINGATIPAAGYKVSGTEYLKSGKLTFRTRTLASGTCKAPNKTEGIVFADYTMGSGGAGSLPSKMATADFEFENSTNVVLVKAFGHSVAGSRTVERMAFSGLNPDDWSTVTLTFQRTSEPAANASTHAK